MSLHLPDDLQRFVNEKVRTGRFASTQEAITEAVRLLREQEECEDSLVLGGIRHGLDEMHAGKGRPADEVFDEIRREFGLDTDA